MTATRTSLAKVTVLSQPHRLASQLINFIESDLFFHNICHSSFTTYYSMHSWKTMHAMVCTVVRPTTRRRYRRTRFDSLCFAAAATELMHSLLVGAFLICSLAAACFAIPYNARVHPKGAALASRGAHGPLMMAAHTDTSDRRLLLALGVDDEEAAAASVRPSATRQQHRRPVIRHP